MKYMHGTAIEFWSSFECISAYNSNYVLRREALIKHPINSVSSVKMFGMPLIKQAKSN
jgi:hypothetical protein